MKRITNKIRTDGVGALLRSAKVNFFYKLESEILFKIPRFVKLCFSQPRLLYIELSSLCNLNCNTCFREEKGSRDQGIMDLNLFRKVIVEASRMGGVSIHLGFAGEPLTYPYLKEVLKIVALYKDSFYKVSLTSNGTLLSPKMSKMILDSGALDWITFSVDGVGKVFEDLRSGADYALVSMNIRTLVGERNVVGKKKPIISINCVLSSQTNEQIGDLKFVWSGVVDQVNISGCIDQNFKFLNMERYLSWNPKAAQKHLNPTCIFPFQNLIVLWDGSITYCCHNLNGEYSFGNAWNQSLREIWRDPEYERAREYLAVNCLPSDSVCFKCRKVFSGMK